MERVNGALSKRILRLGKFSNEPVNPSFEKLVTHKTIEDLKNFRRKAEADDNVIDDLQFMISKDGSIHLVDPARISKLPLKGKERRLMQQRYLKRIDNLIQEFNQILEQ